MRSRLRVSFQTRDVLNEIKTGQALSLMPYHIGCIAFHRSSAPADVELQEYPKKILTLDPSLGHSATRDWSTPKYNQRRIRRDALTPLSPLKIITEDFFYQLYAICHMLFVVGPQGLEPRTN